MAAHMPRTKARTLLNTIAEALNKSSYITWTADKVKSARCADDPDWVFTYKKSLPPQTQADIRNSFIEFYTIAYSYAYHDDDGNDLDPVWEYQHPRSNCDHSESPSSCNQKIVVVPEDANNLMDWIGDGTIGIRLLRDKLGPMVLDDSLEMV